MFAWHLAGPKFLHQILRYEPESGMLFWLPRNAGLFEAGQQTSEHQAARWNSRFSGGEALSAITASGYRAGKIFRKTYYAHRVIWAMQTGQWPEGVLDHKDTDRANNRWNNLRQATHSQNQCNKRLSVANSSGVKGVARHTPTGKWQAYISLNGGQRHLGYFETPELAEIRVNAERSSLHAEFGRAV